MCRKLLFVYFYNRKFVVPGIFSFVCANNTIHDIIGTIDDFRVKLFVGTRLKVNIGLNCGYMCDGFTDAI